MNKQLLAGACILSIIVSVFFYKTLLKGHVPFPGDLLISEYQPWKSYSYLGFVPGSYPNKAQYFDVIRQLYPWKEFAVTQIKSGNLPLWNPYNFSGSPLLANLQSAVFYPTTLLFFIFPMITAWTISIILQPLLASLGTYIYTRRLGLNFLPSLFSSVVYGYSLYMSVFLEYNSMGHVMIWLPFILFTIESYIQTNKHYYLFFLSLSVALTLFAGHLQLSAGVIIFSLGYLFFRYKSIDKKTIKNILYSFVLGVGISTIQLVPTLELLRHSARVDHVYQDLISRLLVQPKQLLMILGPDVYGNPATRNYMLNDSYPGKALYVGFITLFFVIAGIKQKKSLSISFFAVSSLILGVLLLRTPFTELLYALPLPLVSTSAPTNFIFLLSFSLAILSGFGLQHVMTKRLISWRLVFLLTAIPIVLFVFNQSLVIVKSQTIYMFAMASSLLCICILAAWKKIPHWIIGVLCLMIVSADLGYFFLKFNPFVPPELVYPPAPITSFIPAKSQDRFWGYGAASIEANYATQLKRYSPEGYDPLYPKWYGLLLSTTHDGNMATDFTQQTRSDARIAQGFGPEGFTNNHRDSILNVLGVRYILDREDNRLDETIVSEEQFSLLKREDGWLVYNNNFAFPRAFLTAVAPEEFSSSQQIVQSSGSATIRTYSPNRVVLDVSSPQAQYVVLSDTYFPGWRASVNGEQMNVLKVFTALRGVKIPEGISEVEFTYQPLSFIIGLSVSICSFIILCLFMLLPRKRNKI